MRHRGKVWSVPARLGDIIVTHQTWFLSSPRIQALPANDLAVVEEQILPLANLMRVGLSPEATNLNQLQAVSFGQWLAERDEVIALIWLNWLVKWV